MYNYYTGKTFKQTIEKKKKKNFLENLREPEKTPGEKKTKITNKVVSKAA